MTARKPAAGKSEPSKLTAFEAGQERGRQIRAEHPLPADLAAQIGELIRAQAPRATGRAAGREAS